MSTCKMSIGEFEQLIRVAEMDLSADEQATVADIVSIHNVFRGDRDSLETVAYHCSEGLEIGDARDKTIEDERELARRDLHNYRQFIYLG